MICPECNLMSQQMLKMQIIILFILGMLTKIENGSSKDLFSQDEKVNQITCFAYMYDPLNNQMFLWKVTRQICDTLIFLY
jgi:hypothetical protein